jgi:hypothetical protein
MIPPIGPGGKPLGLGAKVLFATTCLQSTSGTPSPDVSQRTGSTVDAQILKRIQGVRAKRSMATSFSVVGDPQQTASSGCVISAGPNCVPKKDGANFLAMLEFGHTMVDIRVFRRIVIVIHRKPRARKGIVQIGECPPGAT